jgi:hypothetical protein
LRCAGKAKSDRRVGGGREGSPQSRLPNKNGAARAPFSQKHSAILLDLGFTDLWGGDPLLIVGEGLEAGLEKLEGSPRDQERTLKIAVAGLNALPSLRLGAG